MPARLDGWIFGPPAAAAEAMTHEFAELCQALGIRGLRFHDLRHEGISRLFERGWSVAEVAAVSGHKTWSQLRRYTQLKAEALARKLAA
jgi:integrase